MPALALSTILERFRTVLEAAAVGLVRSTDAFSHDRQPNAALDQAYYLEDGGMVSNRSQSNFVTARLDRVVIYVAKKLAFDGPEAMSELHDLLNTIERALIDDGPDQGYSVNTEAHRVTRPDGRDYAVGSLTLTVDYDFSEAA